MWYTFNKGHTTCVERQPFAHPSVTAVLVAHQVHGQYLPICNANMNIEYARSVVSN